MSDTQNEPLPGEKAIKVKKAGPILLGADRYDIFEKGQKAIREFVEELFRFLIDFPGMMYLVFILTIIVAGENKSLTCCPFGRFRPASTWRHNPVPFISQVPGGYYAGLTPPFIPVFVSFYFAYTTTANG